MHNRSDTGESATLFTTESHIALEDLYPGAGYEVKVFAISHGLRSEPHDYFQAVREWIKFSKLAIKITSKLLQKSNN